MDTMTLTLVTPEATFFSGSVSMVEAPGTLGDFGVLPGHMPFISTLKAGVVRVHDDRDQVSRIFVAGGIAEVNNTSCTILAERVIDVGKFTRTEVEANLTKARESYENAFEEETLIEAGREKELLEALLVELT